MHPEVKSGNNLNIRSSPPLLLVFFCLVDLLFFLVLAELVLFLSADVLRRENKVAGSSICLYGLEYIGGIFMFRGNKDCMLVSNYSGEKAGRVDDCLCFWYVLERDEAPSSHQII